MNTNQYAQNQLPAFSHLRKLIQVASIETGQIISVRQSKQIAGWMLNYADYYVAYMYSDPTGEKATARALADYYRNMRDEPELEQAVSL